MEKVKNTSQGVNFDIKLSKKLSSHDDSPPPQKVRSLRDIYDSCMFSLMTTEPLSYEEAKIKEEWRNAMKEEIYAIKSNETRELVDLSISCDATEVKWIYKMKYNPDRSVKNTKQG